MARPSANLRRDPPPHGSAVSVISSFTSFLDFFKIAAYQLDPSRDALKYAAYLHDRPDYLFLATVDISWI